MSDAFEILSSDLTEQILSHLPIPCLLRASLTCKLFLSLASSPTFPSSPSPWFFLYGLHNTSSKNNQSFAFDLSSNSWFRLPPPTSLLDNFSASSGFLFSTTSASSFSFSPVLKLNWTPSPPLHFPRRNPLIGVFFPSASNSSTASFIVVGGVRFIGGLVDIEERLAVEIYDPKTNSWDLCPPLPHDFPFGYSSQTLSSALCKNKFYVLGIYSFFVSSFDLKTRSWGPVLTLRPPGVIFSFLIACNGMLVLAGMCNGPHRGPSFNMWQIDEATMEFSEIAVMPQELLYGLVDIEEEFASLKCVGMGNLVYVFNEDYHKRYPACVCELGVGGSSWRKVPPLPYPVNKFHKVISFCSVVSPQDIFQGGNGRIWA